MKKKKPGKDSAKRMQKTKSRQKENYVIRTTKRMRVLRVILWAMLGFIFFRGVLSCLRPDKTSELDAMIKNFRTEFYGTQDTDYEVLAFARNFTNEYLTYEADGKEAFMSRIRPYVSENISSMDEIYDFKSNCEAIYTEAYKISKTNRTQVDVSVLAKVKYTIQETNEDGSLSRTAIKLKDVMLRVPIHISSSGYVVEDVPVYMNDSMLDPSYKQDKEISGNEVDSEPYTEAIENFLKAYYGSDQSVLDYFVSTKADTNKFRCLGGTFKFSKLDNMNAYKEKKGILCVVKYRVIDAINDSVVTQQMNIHIVTSGQRLYVSDYATRTMNFEEE